MEMGLRVKIKALPFSEREKLGTARLPSGGIGVGQNYDDDGDDDDDDGDDDAGDEVEVDGGNDGDDEDGDAYGGDDDDDAPNLINRRPICHVLPPDQPPEMSSR